MPVSRRQPIPPMPPPAELQALVAAYGGRPRRRVSPRAQALVVGYLLAVDVTTPVEARRLGVEDAVGAVGRAVSPDRIWREPR